MEYRDAGGACSDAGPTTGDVIVVTGGCGFLGQHIVKELSESGRNIREIRVFDVAEFERKLEYKSAVEITSVVGDLRMASAVEHALAGADAVIHSAGLVSSSSDPDIAALRLVNIQGTIHVIEACVMQNVSRLVMTSTVDVLVGYPPIDDGNEALPYPDKYLIPGYAETKAEAERLVLRANGTRLRGGVGQLRTLALRPPVMYGELDAIYVTTALHGAQRNNGVLRRIGDGLSRTQNAYVGNVAWSHVVAMEALKNVPDVCAECFHITDGSPRLNTFDFMNYFLVAKGYHLSPSPLPFGPIYYGVRVAEGFHWIVKYITKYEIKLPTSTPGLHYVNTTYTFSGRKARKLLNYEPKYTFNQSLERSINYYNTLQWKSG